MRFATNVISVKMGDPGAHDSSMGKWPNESFNRITYAPGEFYVSDALLIAEQCRCSNHFVSNQKPASHAESRTVTKYGELKSSTASGVTGFLATD
jgi:hypothetical protein